MPTPMIGLGKGDVGIEHINFDPVKTTWKQTNRMILGCWAVYVGLVLCLACAIAWIWNWRLVWEIIQAIWELLVIGFLVIPMVSYARCS